MIATSLAFTDNRAVDRDEVYYRTRAVTAGSGVGHGVLVVNISPLGMMARCTDALAEGERIKLTLPVIGRIDAEVRWWLGGRMGCAFDRPIERAPYFELLSTLLRDS